jgi:hypothetical protein
MTFDLEAMLRALRDVDFTLVGGVAAVVRDAPIMTQDVDILYRIEPSNLVRLEAALLALDAVARDDPRRLRFGISHLETRGHKLTMKRAGALDVLGSINQEQLLFEDVLPQTDLMDFDGIEIKVLELVKLVVRRAREAN